MHLESFFDIIFYSVVSIQTLFFFSTNYLCFEVGIAYKKKKMNHISDILGQLSAWLGWPLS